MYQYFFSIESLLSIFLIKPCNHSSCSPPYFLSDFNENGDICYHFVKGRKGAYQLVHDNYIYRSNYRRQGVQQNILYWECINNRKARCRGRLKTIGDKLYITNANGKLAAC